MYWFMIICWIIMGILAYHMIKYRNPYKLYMVFGKKGSGKTTMMTKTALKYLKKDGMYILTDISLGADSLIQTISVK